LAGEFAVGELLGREQAGGPEGLGRGKGRGVEEVVVAVVGVEAAERKGLVDGAFLRIGDVAVVRSMGMKIVPQTGVVLEHVVAVELVAV
jgi:hypothetical protein